MVELIAAMGVITVATGSIYILVARSIGYSQTVTNRYAAVNLAGEGIELAKRFIDTNVNQGRLFNAGIGEGAYIVDYNDAWLQPYADIPLRFDQATGIYSYDGGVETPFRRRIDIRWIYREGAAEELRVHSVVRWTGRGRVLNTVDLEDHFFNWRP